MPEPLGVIAGGGSLPLRVVQAASAIGRPVHVVVLEGHGDPAAYVGRSHVTLRWGLAAQMLSWLKQQGVREVVLAGNVARPSLLSLRPDAASMKLLGRIGRAAFNGDDSILRAVMKVLAEEGFDVVGAQALLAGLLPEAALLAGPMPDDIARADIARGLAVCHALGAVDVGQSVVVQQGLVLGVETIEGTDALILRAGALKREGPAPILVKALKPAQSTLESARLAGLRGLAFQANGTILLDRDATIAAAEAAGIFLLAFNPAEYSQGVST
jgi:DUF1009 family protein